MVDARTFQALSDPTRLKILSLLGGGSMNVTAMVEKLDCTQPAVSRHLKVLREAGLIVDARRGKWIEYSSNPHAVAEAAEYLKALYAAGPGSGGRSGVNAKRRSPGARLPRVKKTEPVPAREARPKAQAGPDRAPPETPPETQPGNDGSQYVIERDEDFIDDLML